MHVIQIHTHLITSGTKHVLRYETRTQRSKWLLQSEGIILPHSLTKQPRRIHCSKAVFRIELRSTLNVTKIGGDGRQQTQHKGSLNTEYVRMS